MAATRRLLALALMAFLAGLGSAACGAAEQPTPTPTKPLPTSTPTTVAVATPTTRPVIAIPTPTTISTPTPTGLQPKRGGILRVRVSSNPGTLEPLRATETSIGRFLTPIYGTLIQNAPGMDLKPYLAQSWEASEGGKVLTLKLARGVQFQDGTNFSAQAVKAHLDRIRDPAWSSLHREVLAPITSVEIVDEYTVRINFSEPNVTLLARFTVPSGMIPSQKAMESVTPQTLAKFARNPVGAGPFKLVEWRDDSHIVFEKWDRGVHGGKGQPYLDGMLFRIINDPAVALANFRAGDVDMNTEAGTDQVPLYKGLRGVVTYEGWYPRFGYVAVNRTIKPMDDVRVRKALSYAIDRELFAKSVLAGQAIPLYGPVSPYFSWLYDANYKRYAYDPKEAKRLLTEAGYPDGFTIKPMVWFGEQASLPQVSAIQDMLSKVGVKVELLLLASAQASNGYQVEQKYAAYQSSLACPADPDRCMTDHFQSKSPRNVGRTVTPGLDDLLDKQRTLFDPQERRKVLLQAQDIIVENMLEIFVYADRWALPYRDYVKGYIPNWADAGDNWWEIWLDK